jgi:IPT/TIG domain-containing protein
LDEAREAPVIQAAMRHTFKLIALLLFAATAFSQPVITSISPSSGPVAGGTVLTIHGSGFTDVCTVGCAGARAGINVGDLFITSYKVVDANTIVATTPAHLPGTYSIERVQNDGTSRAPHSFTFEGDPADAFDRLLLPVFVPVTPGAFNSQFISRFTMLNKGAKPLDVFGAAFPCFILCPAPETLVATMNGDDPIANLLQTGHPGTFLFVPKGRENDFAGTLRVQDLSRQSQTWGTELPIVHDRDFTDGAMSLLDVPLKAGFRGTLRVYSTTGGLVRVRIYETEDSHDLINETVMPLRAPRDVHDPAYGELGLYLTGNVGRVDIEPLSPGLRFWAFVSVTNNETQHITTITPH